MAPKPKTKGPKKKPAKPFVIDDRNWPPPYGTIK